MQVTGQWYAITEPKSGPGDQYNQRHIQRLQSVQNVAARLIFNLKHCDHITNALSVSIGSVFRSELHSTWRC